MSGSAMLQSEVWFLLRDRAFRVWVLVVLLFSGFAVWSGLAEVAQQRQSIAFLVDADSTDRTSEFSAQGDWGSAAYYSFHLTYDPPSDFAFAAMGQRDASSWKHRLRMLALEGQIYEHDPGNPELALIGRFDFAFFAAFVLPLVLIFLLHDLKAGERTAGRFNLLVASAGNDNRLWWTRSLLRAIGVLIAAVGPLLVGGVVSGTSAASLLGATAMVTAYVLFWTVVCLWLGSRQHPASVILASLIGVWVLLGTLLPASGRVIIDRLVSVPSGADILMTQREAVNDAWDLPVADTMAPFVARHPEWTGYTHTGDGFDWGWYYAFQQVGDQTTESLSAAYREGRARRDQLAAWFAIAAPPALLERWLQKLAGTNVEAVLDYEESVRAFHAELRAFYYPGLFGDAAFDPARIDDLPQFSSSE
ncbi:MAG: DUF3526 domain-containing protein [Pseudomonadota bacterium]